MRFNPHVERPTEWIMSALFTSAHRDGGEGLKLAGYFTKDCQPSGILGGSSSWHRADRHILRQPLAQLRLEIRAANTMSRMCCMISLVEVSPNVRFDVCDDRAAVVASFSPAASVAARYLDATMTWVLRGARTCVGLSLDRAVIVQRAETPRSGPDAPLHFYVPSIPVVTLGSTFGTKLDAQSIELRGFHRKVHPLVGDLRSNASEHAAKTAQLRCKRGCR